MRKITSIILCMIMFLSITLTGCSPQYVNLMDNVNAQTSNIEPVSVGGKNALKPMNFSIRLFRECLDTNKNTMISPVSVLYALAMTANGAKENTLSQMEDVLGMSVSELNTYLNSYKNALPQNKKYKLNIANSIWLTNDERFSVSQDFLQTNANYYCADIYRVPFDKYTHKEINSWVRDNTDGMIKNMLDGVPEEAIMYLVNAMSFDAEWQKTYDSNQVWDSTFTTENEISRDIKMMYSEEQLYLNDENATGFIKNYYDSKYAFAALLPNEGMSIDEYTATLTGEGLSSLLANPQQTKVHTGLPKFENEYSVEMKDILTAMGMQDAFDENAADFSGLGDSSNDNIFISRVLHKTFIAVNEKGTKAGAATAVEMKDTSAAIEEEIKEVILNRPFIYMIIDRKANLPLFIGTMMDAE